MNIEFRVVNYNFSYCFCFVVYIFQVGLEFNFFGNIFNGQIINNFVFVWFIMRYYLSNVE